MYKYMYVQLKQNYIYFIVLHIKYKWETIKHDKSALIV